MKIIFLLRLLGFFERIRSQLLSPLRTPFFLNDLLYELGEKVDEVWNSSTTINSRVQNVDDDEVAPSLFIHRNNSKSILLKLYQKQFTLMNV